jgi:hypothetical protein
MVSYCCCVRMFESTRNSSSCYVLAAMCAPHHLVITVLTVLSDRLVMAVLKPSAMLMVVVVGWNAKMYFGPHKLYAARASGGGGACDSAESNLSCIYRRCAGLEMSAVEWTERDPVVRRRMQASRGCAALAASGPLGAVLSAPLCNPTPNSLSTYNVHVDYVNCHHWHICSCMT